MSKATDNPYTPWEPWAIEWQSDPAPDGAIEEITEWMRSRPCEVKEVMRRFPPACLVRALRPLHTPAPGTTGLVWSYTEDGKLSVLQTPQSPVRAYCDPAWLEVVGYRFGIDEARVQEILIEETYNCSDCGVPLIRKENTSLFHDGQPLYCYTHWVVRGMPDSAFYTSNPRHTT